VDHGKDFRSHYLEGQSRRLGRIKPAAVDLFAQAHGLGVMGRAALDGLWQSLGIGVRHPIPYNAQAKPIERFFGTLERDFVQDLPGWCASKVDLRPADILNSQIRRHEAWLRGEVEETPFLHIGEFALLFEKWLYERYLRQSHARLGCAPLEAYQRDYGHPTVLNERSLDILLMRAEKRLVRRNGLELFERNRWYWSEKLVGREGTHVEVRWDPRDLGKVLVYGQDGYLCEALNLELSNFHPTLEQMRQYKRMKKLQRELVYAQLELMHLAADDLLALGTGRRPRKQPRLGGSRFPALEPPGADRQEPVFTSKAARKAWEMEKDYGQNAI
jgi:putative transposase